MCRRTSKLFKRESTSNWPFPRTLPGLLCPQLFSASFGRVWTRWQQQEV